MEENHTISFILTKWSPNVIIEYTELWKSSSVTRPTELEFTRLKQIKV